MLFDEPTSALDPEMINEVLDVMVKLAQDGMTMLCVTHEMGFARKVAHKVIFMDGGRIIEDCSTDDFFGTTRSERAQQFLAKILASLRREGRPRMAEIRSAGWPKCLHARGEQRTPVSMK